MGMIDLSKLERNQATEPFHVAAGIEVFQNKPWELSTNECLLYQIHQTRSDTFLRTGNEAHDFLKGLEPNQAQAIQKRADTMCGMAERLTANSPILNSKYQKIYKENPNLTVAQLERTTERNIKLEKMSVASLNGVVTGVLAYAFILVTPLPGMALIGSIAIGGLVFAAIFFNKDPIQRNLFPFFS